MTIEQHVEELRAELRNAVDPVERGWIVAELERAQAEMNATWNIRVEEDGSDDVGPPV